MVKRKVFIYLRVLNLKMAYNYTKKTGKSGDVFKSKKHQRKRLNKKDRTFIFERDNYICNRCKLNLIDKPELRVIDHKIPLDKGGSNDLKNLWLLCDECDKKKRNKLEPDLTKEYMAARINFLKRKV